ncbi:MAG TPA: cytidine/deoxycytidylate deaminase family protein [bacterium]|nr:cytidine/deoxycytidylate deaminase family protein [bacterium]
MSDRRPAWDEYFMKICNVVAERSTCIRRHVGALIVKDKRILATGYNGAPSGLTHCEQIGCLREKMGIPSGERQEICRGLHAEQNAIIQASQYGFSIAGSTLYCTTQPCITCAKMIINAGIERIVFEGDYPDSLSLDMIKEAGLDLIKYSNGGDGNENGGA